MRNVQETFTQIVEQVPYLPEELQLAVANIDDPSALSHLIAGSLRLPTEEKQALLEEVDVAERLRRLVEHARARARGHLDRLARSSRRSSPRSTRASASTSCASSSRRSRRSSASSTRPPPRPSELREQLARARAAGGRPQAGRPRARPPRAPAARRPPSTASSAPTWSGSRRCRGTSAPRTTSTSAHAREVLDDDHYDLEQVKDRILEFLAVRKLKPRARRGRSSASSARPAWARRRSAARSPRALGRKFERISVGGVRDEAEIRGHRRTYIGAMPGTIIRALRDAGSRQPAVHDRRDRQDGRRTSAATRRARCSRCSTPSRTRRSATTTSTCRSTCRRSCSSRRPTRSTRVPGPLRDRMEVIELAGYTEDEKLQIAKRYLVPRQIERNGLKQVAGSRSPTRRCATIISDYTREAGVRSLEREIGTVCRKVARQVAEGDGDRRRVSVTDAERSRELLGRRALPRRGQAAHARARRRDRPGLDAGRRRHALHRGHGDARQGQACTLTGQLGDVMKESAQAALSLRARRTRRARARLEDDWFADARPPHPRPRGRDPEGRPARRHHDGDRARRRSSPAARSATTSR